MKSIVSKVPSFIVSTVLKLEITKIISTVTYSNLVFILKLRRRCILKTKNKEDDDSKNETLDEINVPTDLKMLFITKMFGRIIQLLNLLLHDLVNPLIMS